MAEKEIVKDHLKSHEGKQEALIIQII